MVAKSLLVVVLLRVILPLAVILGIVFGVTHFGFKQVYGIGLFESMRIEKNVKQVIEEFMEAGEAMDIEAAYGYVYYRSEEELSELIARNYDRVFAGYKSLTINYISFLGRDSDWHTFVPLPGHGAIDGDGDGGVMRLRSVKGDINYTSGKVMQLEAWMMRENGIWKISSIEIGVNLLIRCDYLGWENVL